MRTYLDSGVLIAAARGTEPLARAALTILGDPQRILLSSIIVALEVLPKPRYFHYDHEVRFYETYIHAVAAYHDHISSSIAEEALRLAAQYGLAAMDALHVTIALHLGAEELITTEGIDKPMHRVALLRVIPLMV